MVWPFRRRRPSSSVHDPESRAITFHDLWGFGANHQDAFARGDEMFGGAGSLDRALSLIPVYAATSLIADLIAGCPIHGFRKTGAMRVELDPQPQLILDPTQYGTSVDWVHRAVTSLCLRGNAFGFITGFDRLGWPTQIEWLHPDHVTLDDNRTEGSPRWRIEGRPVDADLIVHIPYYTVPGYVLGLSPIKAYAAAIDTGLFAHHFGRDYFRNGSVPAGILKTDQRIDDETQIDVIKARFKRNAARREPVVLGSGLDYKTISVAPNESQFLETLRFTASQIAAIYHLHPEMIGGDQGRSASITYANVEQRALETVKLALMPYVRRIEEALRRQLPGQQYCRFNLDSFVRADLKTRYEAHSIALADGWMSRDEVRDIEDLSPMPNGLGDFDKPPPAVSPEPSAPDAGSGPQNGSTAASGAPATVGSPSPAAAATSGRGARNGARNGRALTGWDHLIALHGRRSDPWL